jgi:RHS repeat-associated protein
MTQVSNGYRYAINGLGQRVSKIGPVDTTYFVYDEQGRLIGEYDASGAPKQELVWLADTPVASVRPGAGGGVAIYPIYTDHLNTPRLITDMANRTVWEWPLDTFGAGAAKENPSGLGSFLFNLRFPGQYYDVETRLHYNYFRDYDPSVGRYVRERSDWVEGRHQHIRLCRQRSNILSPIHSGSTGEPNSSAGYSVDSSPGDLDYPTSPNYPYGQ